MRWRTITSGYSTSSAGKSSSFGGVAPPRGYSVGSRVMLMLLMQYRWSVAVG